MTRKIRVGLIGAGAGGSDWGARAHVPALQALPDYELVAVCTSRQETADASARAHGVRLAFGDPRAMAAHPDVDLVAIAVRTPAHRGLIEAAIEAGKNIYCEWPFCRTTADAEAVRDAALAKNLVTMAGFQAIADPELNHARDLIAQGYCGQVLSSTVIVSTGTWGAKINAANAYLYDVRNGATALTIPGGHTLAGMAHVLGEFHEVTATMATIRDSAEIAETGDRVALTAPDQIAITGRLGGGQVAAVHVRAGMQSLFTRFEINGTAGDILIETTAFPGLQYGSLTVKGRQGGTGDFVAIPTPASYRRVPDSIPAGPAVNVAQMYEKLARHLEDGTPSWPDFTAGVRHKKLIDAIVRSSETGSRQKL